MDPLITDQFSFWDKLGIIPVFLSVTAVVFGVVALVVRREIYSRAANFGVLAAAFFGVSEIGRRLYEFSQSPWRGGQLNYADFFLEVGNQCLVLWVIMGSAGIGMALVALSVVLRKKG